MSYDTEMSQELGHLTSKFVNERLAPLIHDDENTGTFRPEIIAALGQLGLTGVPLSETYGGAGLGYLEYIRVIQEIASVSSGYAISVSVTGLAQMILEKFGNEEQKKKYIPKLASGQAIGAFSLSEPSSGSDAASLLTTAKKDGTDYILNGTKLWTTQADVADVIIVMARTGGPGPKGISSFIVEKGMPGLKMGKCEKKMGLNVSHTMEVHLDHVRVPAQNLLSQEGDGFKIAEC